MLDLYSWVSFSSSPVPRRVILKRACNGCSKALKKQWVNFKARQGSGLQCIYRVAAVAVFRQFTNHTYTDLSTQKTTTTHSSNHKKAKTARNINIKATVMFTILADSILKQGYANELLCRVTNCI